MATIFKRGKVWYSRIEVNGKKIRKVLSTDKTVALKMLADLKTDIKSDKYGLNKPDWEDFKNKYLAWSKANKSEHTYYRDTLSLRYLEEFKEIQYIAELNIEFLDNFKTYLKNKNEILRKEFEDKKGRSKKRDYRRCGMTEQGLNRTIQSIKAIARKAEDWKLIPAQKWNAIGKYKVAKGRIEFYSTVELKSLLKTAKGMRDKQTKYSPWETVILLGARAGLRRGEMQNLMWKDIDFKKGVLSITPKPDWSPKDFECRDIPLSADLKEYLSKVPHYGNYVLYDTYGYRFSIDSLTTYFREKVVRKSGIEGNVHKLRHTFASHLVQNGVDLYVIKELLGHSSITTTEIYAHLRPFNHQQAINQLPPL